MVRKKRRKTAEPTTPTDQDHVRKVLKEQVRKLLQDRVQHYRKQRDDLWAYLKRDPGYPTRQKQEDREGVARELKQITAMWDEVAPYIRHIKAFVGDILEPGRLTACYLLFGKLSQGFAAIFLLARMASTTR